MFVDIVKPDVVVPCGLQVVQNAFASSRCTKELGRYPLTIVLAAAICHAFLYSYFALKTNLFPSSLRANRHARISRLLSFVGAFHSDASCKVFVLLTR